MVYEPLFRRQLTGTACGHANCNMAAAAHLADRATFGLVQRTADQMRTLSGTAAECTDADPRNDGTSQGDALVALAKLGLAPTAYDRSDGLAPSELRAYVVEGLGAIVMGDYDRVPLGLRGDREFLGFHSVWANEWTASVMVAPRLEFAGYTGPAYRVWDSLNDGRADRPSGKIAPKGPIWWPEPVMAAYAEAMAAGAGNLLVIVPDRVRATVRVNVANVRTGPGLSFPVFTRRSRGTVLPASALPDIGAAVGGERRWWRVWAGERVGYMHASVVTIATV